MKTRTLTQHDIVGIFTNHLEADRAPLGFDDDIAAYSFSKNDWLILKTDMLVGSTDIPRGMKYWQAARKAIVAVISDFASKGVRPQVLLLSLGLPRNANRSMVTQLSTGFRKGAREYGCTIIGGDTGTANDLVIDIIGAGFAKPHEIVKRHGARPGDIVVSTGMFGRTAAGLQILASRKGFAGKYPSLLRAVLNPVARLNTGVEMAKSHAVTSAIDSSDGLAWSLHLLAQLNQVDMNIDNVPIAKEVARFAKETGSDPMDLAFYGGEEYEIIATVRSDYYRELKHELPSLIEIGSVEKGKGNVFVSIKQSRKVITAKGWDPFRDS